MASGMFFVRSCPTCGRKLEIRVELLGRDVECVHCSATFVAREDNVHGDAADRPSEQRIEKALAKAQQYIDSVGPMGSTTAK